VYLTGVALVAAGASILINWQARLAATVIGIMILVFDLLTWGPRFFAQPGALVGNWLKDLGVIGGVLILASALANRGTSGEGRPDVVAAKSAS
jgi:putative oxidoreductase